MTQPLLSELPGHLLRKRNSAVPIEQLIDHGTSSYIQRWVRMVRNPEPPRLLSGEPP
jgi:hypothetical protein